MDEKLRIEVSSLSFAFDCVFGPHDAAAYIRREEENLQNSQNNQEEGEKLIRRATQQRTAIERFLDRAEVSQKLGLSIQDNWSHVESIITQFNTALENEAVTVATPANALVADARLADEHEQNQCNFIVVAEVVE